MSNLVELPELRYIKPENRLNYLIRKVGSDEQIDFHQVFDIKNIFLLSKRDYLKYGRRVPDKIFLENLFSNNTLTLDDKSEIVLRLFTKKELIRNLWKIIELNGGNVDKFLDTIKFKLLDFRYIHNIDDTFPFYTANMLYHIIKHDDKLSNGKPTLDKLVDHILNDKLYDDSSGKVVLLKSTFKLLAMFYAEKYVAYNKLSNYGIQIFTLPDMSYALNDIAYIQSPLVYNFIAKVIPASIFLDVIDDRIIEYDSKIKLLYEYKKGAMGLDKSIGQWNMRYVFPCDLYDAQKASYAKT